MPKRIIELEWDSQPPYSAQISPQYTATGWRYASNAGLRPSTDIKLPGADSPIIAAGLKGHNVDLTINEAHSLELVVSNSWSLLITFRRVADPDFPYFLGISGSSYPTSLASRHASFANNLIWYDGTAGRDSGFLCPEGEIVTVGITFDLAALTYKFYKNGVPGNTVVGLNTGSGTWQIASAVTASSNHDIFQLAFANQVSPPEEMRRLGRLPWQIFEPEVISVQFSAASGAAALAGNAAATAASSAQITTAIPVAGASVSQATSSGIFTTALTFQVSASAGVNVAGDLFTQIKFDGAALAQALAQAGLSTGIPFAAAAAAQAGSGGDITIQINFLGAAVANALVQGTLSGGASGFEGAAAGRASSSAQLTTAIPVAGNAQAYSNSSGGLTTVLPLNGVVAAINNVSGDLSVAIRFNAQALAQALASADFTVQIRLNGAALAQAAVSGTLAGTAPQPSLNPRYTVDIEPRLYVVESAPRIYEVAM